MKCKLCHWFLFLSLLSLFSSCSSENEYDYPSVIQDFLTAQTDADGYLYSVFTDAGKSYRVLEDVSKVRTTPNTSLRVVSNYTQESSANEVEGVKLYAVMNSVSPQPQTADKFKDGVKTDPANVQSIWLGWGYLNIVLEVKAQHGKHLFHFIEDEVVRDDTSGHTTVFLTLYHDDSEDVQAYTQRAYLSVPLNKYATEGVAKVTVKFTAHIYSGQVKTFLFEYFPNKN